jgi:hypothetical protein
MAIDVNTYVPVPICWPLVYMTTQSCLTQTYKIYTMFCKETYFNVSSPLHFSRKVGVILEQAMKAQTGSTVIALHFL